jgi:hypothetical protein
MFAYSLITARQRGKWELAFAHASEGGLGSLCALVSSSVPCGGDPIGPCWKDAYMLSRYRLRSRGLEGRFLVLLCILRLILSSDQFVPFASIATHCTSPLILILPHSHVCHLIEARRQHAPLPPLTRRHGRHERPRRRNNADVRLPPQQRERLRRETTHKQRSGS